MSSAVAAATAEASDGKEKPIRFGIVGYTEISRRISRAISLAANAVLVAVAGRSADMAARFVSDNPSAAAAVRSYGTYEDLIDDPDVDAVYLPLPTAMHVHWAVEAAGRGKHLLVEKPAAPCAADLDRILSACAAAGVQFMDTTMWVHHPRTAMMKELLSDPSGFGHLNKITCTFTFAADPDFLRNDIRMNPKLDTLGALGDAGWYCIRSILWAANYELPKTAVAFPRPVLNEANVILSCDSSLVWGDGRSAAFHCSFLSNLAMDLNVYGSNGVLRVHDFVIPFKESAASFAFASRSGFTELVTGWQPLPVEHVVAADLPQEALMVEEFSRLVAAIRDAGSEPESSWPTISRKTQLVLDAVKASIDMGGVPVEIGT